MPLGDASQQPVAFVDFERSSPLLILALAFAALVVLLGRWHGVRALAGSALSLALVGEFLAPAILDGRPLVLTALVGALAVMVVTIVLSHGVRGADRGGDSALLPCLVEPVGRQRA